MILVDSQIREEIENGLIENFCEDSIQSVCYDLIADKFIETVENRQESYENFCLPPKRSIFVATREIIKFDFNMIGHISCRNSRIREGLRIDAPIYQPGNYTKIYFRITNVSNSAIQLRSGKSYACVMFEKLDREPENPYNGTFQHELDYTHLGDYSSEYDKEINRFDEKIEALKAHEKTIYGNVIAILTIFITIFTILNINVSFSSNTNLDWRSFLLFNLCTIGSISLLGNLISSYLQQKNFVKLLWFVPALCFAVAIFILWLL